MKAGTERVMSDKMNYLAARGYDISLITYEQGMHPKAYYLHPSIRYVDLGTRFFELERYGFIKRLPIYFLLRLKFRKRLKDVLEKIKPDIVISTTYSIKLLDIILSVNSQAHNIVESHIACYTVKKSYDYRDRFFFHYLAKMYDKWILGKLSKADALVVLTKGDAKDWKEYANNIVVIPNPVTYYPESIASHDCTNKRILCVGRLQEQKGFDMLIDAFAQIAHLCEGWTIVIYGDGNDKFSLLEKIRNLKLDGRIFICPPVDDIYNEYQHSDFFVLSSRFEGLPLVLGEAMACGIPCVSFRCKYGPEDIIDDGKNGLLVANGNIKDLGEKMLWMIEHKEERLCMGERARKDIKRLEKDSIMKKWLDLFQSYEEMMN